MNRQLKQINMKVNVLTFGQVTEITGKSTLQIKGVKNTKELSLKLNELFPSLSEIKFSLAVNKNFVVSNTVLTDGDAIALLPPFSGG